MEACKIAARERPEKFIALDEVLSGFEQIDAVKAKLVKVRYFAGLTIREAAAALGISTTTADRYWVYARAWLQHEMSGPEQSPGG